MIGLASGKVKSYLSAVWYAHIGLGLGRPSHVGDAPVMSL